MYVYTSSNLNRLEHPYLDNYTYRVDGDSAKKAQKNNHTFVWLVVDRSDLLNHQIKAALKEFV